MNIFFDLLIFFIGVIIIKYKKFTIIMVDTIIVFILGTGLTIKSKGGGLQLTKKQETHMWSALEGQARIAVILLKGENIFLLFVAVCWYVLS